MKQCGDSFQRGGKLIDSRGWGELRDSLGWSQGWGEIGDIPADSLETVEAIETIEDRNGLWVAFLFRAREPGGSSVVRVAGPWK